MNLCEPPAAEASEDRVIAEKTAFWQEEQWAVRHLKNSGVRPGPLFAPIFQRILSLIPKESKVLDVGCGHGRLSIPLAEAGHRVVATDVSAQMLGLLQRVKGDVPVEIRQGDAHRLAAADGEFDVVLSYDFIPHFPDWPRLLAEKARACRKGGRVIFGFNFTEHRTFSEPLGGGSFAHPYSPDVQSSKPFWAEATLAEMTQVGRGLGLEVLQVLPVKFLSDSYGFGGALGTDDYQTFQAELAERLERDPAAAAFYSWLENRLFQRLPFFAAYSSLIVFHRTDLDPVATPMAAKAGGPRPAAAVREPGQFLSEIPSETSLAERLLLFNYFRREWSGSGAVVEIGPFLGGTTRAIAAGMLQNPRCDSRARLHTFDRFGDYYAPERLREMIAPLVAAKSLPASQADDLCKSGNFLGLFAAVHGGHDYYRLIETHTAPLPELPEEIAGSAALRALQDESDLSALFIDGCKSWASTHYAMKFLLPRTRVGAPVIFQDYGWYTCFWIPAFAAALGEFLALEKWVDSTYVFTLKAKVSADEIARRFTQSPEEMGGEFFKQACLAAMKDCVKRNDRRGGLVAQLHLVAALATLNREAEAARILAKIDAPSYGELAFLVEGSRRSPTYRPGNRPILWKVD